MNDPNKPRPKRFHVMTWGCQMNVDDSDQIENLLLSDGLEKADSLEDADVIMLNTPSSES
jgi:tRNA-2-methylthio-N6-dimethylallyladenosine synthase